MLHNIRPPKHKNYLMQQLSTKAYQLYSTVKEQFKLVFQSSTSELITTKDSMEKYFLYRNALITVLTCLYPFFIISQIVDYFKFKNDVLEVITQLFIVRHVLWFTAICSFIYSKYISNAMHSIGLIIAGWVLTIIPIITTVSIPYANEKFFKWDFQTNNTTTAENTELTGFEDPCKNNVMRQLCKFSFSVYESLAFFFAFLVGLYISGLNIPKQLIKFKFEITKDIFGLETLKQFGLFWICVQYLIVVILSYWEILMPLYFVLWRMSAFLRLADSHYSLFWYIGSRLLIISVAILKFDLQHDHQAVISIFGIILLFISTLILITFNFGITVLMMWLITELFYITIYILNGTYDKTISKHENFFLNRWKYILLAILTFAFVYFFLLLNISAEAIINEGGNNNDIASGVFILIVIIILIIYQFIPENTIMYYYLVRVFLTLWTVSMILSTVSVGLYHSNNDNSEESKEKSLLYYLGIVIYLIINFVVLLYIIFKTCYDSYEFRQQRNNMSNLSEPDIQLNSIRSDSKAGDSSGSYVPLDATPAPMNLVSSSSDQK